MSFLANFANFLRTPILKNIFWNTLFVQEFNLPMYKKIFILFKIEVPYFSKKLAGYRVNLLSLAKYVPKTKLNPTIFEVAQYSFDSPLWSSQQVLYHIGLFHESITP